MRSETEIASKKTPNNKRNFPSPGEKSFEKILKGAAPGRGWILNMSQKAEELVGPSLWELVAKSFYSAATFSLGLCFIFAAAGPVQGNNSLVLLSTNLFF